MSIPTWAREATFLPSAATFNTYGLDWDSVCQGDVSQSDWSPLYAGLEQVTATSLVRSILAPDGTSTQTAVTFVDGSTAVNRGLRAYLVVANATGTLTLSVAMRLADAVGSGKAVLAIFDGSGAQISTRTCILSAIDALYTVQADVTEGSEYQLVVASNWTAAGGSAACRFYTSKARAQITNGYGIFRGRFVRVDARPGAQWGDDGRSIAAKRSWTNLTCVRRRLALDIASGQFAIEWTPSAAGLHVNDLEIEQSATQSGVPDTQLRIFAAGTPDVFSIARGSLGAGNSSHRLMVPDSYALGLRAIYVPARADLAFPAVPNAGEVVVVYGDSISSGTMTPQTFVRQSWIGVLQSRMAPTGILLNEAFPGRTLFNDGFRCTGGVIDPAFSAARAACIAGIVAQNPKKLFALIGTNDITLTSPAVNAADFGTAYAAFLDGIHAALPSLHVYCCSPLLRQSPAAFAEGVANSTGATIGNYRTQIASAVAARSSFATYLDGSTVLASNRLTGYTNADGIHPSPRAATELSNAVAAFCGIP